MNPIKSYKRKTRKYNRTGGNIWLVLILSVIVFCGSPLEFQAGDRCHGCPVCWSYTGATRAELWGDLSPSYSMCKTGNHQSPIDISNTVPGDLGDIRFSYRDMPLEIMNTGHTVEVIAAEGNSNTITIRETVYQLDQIHFHSPSEHQRNGYTYDMEMHLVHKDAQERLAVVGVFLNVGAETNSTIQTIWCHIPTAVNQAQKPVGIRLNAALLLPHNGTYYYYDGSLTTPPCSQEVKWYVLKEPVLVSQNQVREFLDIFGPNARPVQPLNERRVNVVERGDIVLTPH